MGMTSKDLEQLYKLPKSLQLPTEEDVLVFITSTINTSDKRVLFNHLIAYKSREYMSGPFHNLEECIFDAYDAMWKLKWTAGGDSKGLWEID